MFIVLAIGGPYRVCFYLVFRSVLRLTPDLERQQNWLPGMLVGQEINDQKKSNRPLM